MAAGTAARGRREWAGSWARDGSIQRSPSGHQKVLWYPVAFAESLGTGSLVPFDLMGVPWVLFRDQTGSPACLLDACAHRACPLSTVTSSLSSSRDLGPSCPHSTSAEGYGSATSGKRFIVVDVLGEAVALLTASFQEQPFFAAVAQRRSVSHVSALRTRGMDSLHPGVWTAVRIRDWLFVNILGFFPGPTPDFAMYDPPFCNPPVNICHTRPADARTLCRESLRASSVAVVELTRASTVERSCAALVM